MSRSSSCSPLLQQLFTRTAPETVPEDQRTTRGQVSNLLQVPFLRGPAGRSTMMFRGSILWNALPSDFRVIRVPGPFRKALSAIDILAYFVNILVKLLLSAINSNLLIYHICACMSIKSTTCS